MQKILLVAGARPNFMKVSPLWRELRKYPEAFQTCLIHTGQHYDTDMSQAFFKDLELPQPDRFLGVGSGTHAEQTGKVMIAFEQACVEQRPDLVTVVGDVNSTMACALTAKKMGIPVAHVEAGLRSRDWTMPEEVNRVVTDSISDYLFTPSQDTDENLLKEGVSRDRIHFVGNIMIDALIWAKPRAEALAVYSDRGLAKGSYGLVTIHRPTNVDDPSRLQEILGKLARLNGVPLVFPVHPRTRKNLKAFGIERMARGIRGLQLIEPLGYLDFLNLLMHCRFALTDSGGIQEETTWLGIPCLTLRENTERPVTITKGTNKLVNVLTLNDRIEEVWKESPCKESHIPPLWDGKTAKRIVAVLRS